MADSDAEGIDSEFIDEEEADMGPAAIKKLREKLKIAVEEKQDYLDKWQRLQADFANFKRQEVLINADKEERIKAEFIEKLLPLFDVIELTRKHAVNADTAALERQFLSTLKDLGIEKIDLSTGIEFNHYIHEAIGEVATDDAQLDQTIFSYERSGYRIGEKIIRPAQIRLQTYKQN